jgi:acid phosphatase family membrane protein YuiD
MKLSVNLISAMFFSVLCIYYATNGLLSAAVACLVALVLLVENYHVKRKLGKKQRLLDELTTDELFTLRERVQAKEEK